MSELARFAEDYARREAEIEALREQLRQDRLDAIREAYAAGLPAVEIGAQLGVTRQRILQLLAGGR